MDGRMVMKFAAFLYRFFAFACCLLLIIVIRLWMEKVSGFLEQASRQMLLGYIGITCWLDCGREDEVYTHHITSRWKERIIRVVKRPPLSF